MVEACLNLKLKKEIKHREPPLTFGEGEGTFTATDDVEIIEVDCIDEVSSTTPCEWRHRHNWIAPPRPGKKKEPFGYCKHPGGKARNLYATFGT